MDQVLVKYLNVYTDLTGKKEESINLAGGQTLKHLLEKLTASDSPKFSSFILDENQKLKPHIWLFVNRKREINLERKLKDGDKVVFSLTPVGG